MKKGLINILLYITIPSLIYSIIYRYQNINNILYFLCNTIPYIILLIYYIIIYKKILFNYIKKLNKKNILYTIIIWIIGFILMMLSNYIINYLIIPNGISNNELNNRQLLFEHKYTYTIILGLIIPILEEISFRLEFKHNIKNRYIFLILSSILFASIHIINITSLIEIIYIIPYLILGLTFTYTYLKTNNLICSIISHILHNTITIILLLLF